MNENAIIKHDMFRSNAFKIAARFQAISYHKDYHDYLKIIRNHLVRVMMEEPKDKFRVEAVRHVWLPKRAPKDADDLLCLRLFVMKTLDRQV